MATGQRKKSGRARAVVLIAGFFLVTTLPVFAAPGFGTKSGASAGARAGASRGQVSAGSRAGVATPRPSGDAIRPGGRSATGWGTRPNGGVNGGRPDTGSRDRFFRDRPNAGSYGVPGRTIIRRERLSPHFFYDPFYRASPFYSPFTPFTWGYDPFYGTFGYHDWYTSSDRRRPLPSATERYGDEEWPDRARGNVVLDIEPRDVEVRVNGALTTRDGRAVINLPAGTYRIQVSRSGYRTWETELVVNQGVQYRLQQRLERLRPGEPGATESGTAPRLVGEMILDVTPDDAIVSINGRLLGIVNLLREGTALRSIPVGEHVIEIERPGYKTVRREVTIDAREPLKLSVRMERQ